MARRRVSSAGSPFIHISTDVADCSEVGEPLYRSKRFAGGGTMAKEIAAVGENGRMHLRELMKTFDEAIRWRVRLQRHV